MHYSFYKYGPLKSSGGSLRLETWMQTILKLNIKTDYSSLVEERCRGPFFLRFLIFLP